MNGDDELPEGWVSTALSNVATPSKRKVEPNECPEVAYLSLEHIEAQTGTILGYGKGSDVNSTKAVFASGDILYGKLRPYLNKVAIPDRGGICSTDILVFEKHDLLNNQYLRRYLSTPGVVEFANHNSSGIQLPRISFEKLGELRIP